MLRFPEYEDGSLNLWLVKIRLHCVQTTTSLRKRESRQWKRRRQVREPEREEKVFYTESQANQKAADSRE